MKPVFVRWEGAQFSNHSLAHVNRKLTTALAKDPEFRVSIIPYGDDTMPVEWDQESAQVKKLYQADLPAVDFHVFHQWPPSFEAPPEGKWILFQPWELGSIPHEWVGPIHYLIDELWVNSQYTKDTYVRSGIPEEKVFCFPLGVDTKVYTPEGQKLELPSKKKFRFLFVGGTIWRKGIHALLQSYIDTFRASDDVTLVVKDFGTRTYYSGQTAQDIIKKIKSDPNSPEILYIDQDMPPLQLASLYRSCDCYVAPYRGEGFGLPILEAMACGLPVIIPDKGPATEFTNSQVAFYVKSTIKDFPDEKYNGIPLSGSPSYIDVDIDALSQVMRDVSASPLNTREKGLQAAIHAKSKYSWSHSSRLMIEHLLRTNTGERSRDKTYDWLQEALDQTARTNWSLAVYAWNDVRMSKSYDPAVDRFLGICFTKLRNYGAAITHFLRFLQAASTPEERQDTLCYLGGNERASKNYLSAARYFEAALQIEPHEYIQAALHEAMQLHQSTMEQIDNRKDQRKLQFDPCAILSNFRNIATRQPDRALWISKLFLKGDHGLVIGHPETRWSPAPHLDLSTINFIDLAELSAYTESRLAEHVSVRDDFFLVDDVLDYLSVQDLERILALIKHNLHKTLGRVVITGGGETIEYSAPHSLNDPRRIRRLSLSLASDILHAMGLTITEASNFQSQAGFYVVGRSQAHPLLWDSPVLNTSGYATSCKMLLEGMRPYPYDIQLRIRESDSRRDLFSPLFIDYVDFITRKNHKNPTFHIQIIPGHSIGKGEGTINVGRTMFETDRLPEDWVYRCNQLTEIWVPSQFNMSTFRKSGVASSKLYALPESTDFSFFDPVWAGRNSAKDLKEFVFLSIFDWNFRKGWDVLIRAYIDEFSEHDDVTLLIKVSPFRQVQSSSRIREFISSQGRDPNHIPNIEITEDFMDESSLRSLYASCDAFVLPTRGEGWGRPFMEAMAMGLPTIGTRWGGSADFMNDDNAWMIEIDGLEDVDSRMDFSFYRGHQWASPSIKSLRDQLRTVFEHRAEAREVIHLARPELRDRYDLPVVCSQFHNRLLQLLHAQPSSL